MKLEGLRIMLVKGLRSPERPRMNIKCYKKKKKFNVTRKAFIVTGT